MAAHRLSCSALAALMFAFALVTAPCARADNRLRDAIVGTWTLASIYEEDESGEELDRWGNRPSGRLIADASGHFMLQIVGRDAIEIAMHPHALVSNELAPKYIGDRRILNYAGKYLIDEKQERMILNVEDALDAAWDRCRPSSVISLEADALHFVSASEVSPTGAFYVHMIWKRAR